MAVKKFSDLTKREKMLVVIAGILAGIFLIYFVLIDTVNGYIEDLDKKINEAKSKRDELSFRLTLLKKFSKSFSQFKNLQKKINTYVFKGSIRKASNLLKNILKNYEIEPRVQRRIRKTKIFNLYDFIFRFTTKYSKLIKIFNDIEYNKNIILIKKMRISSLKKGNLKVIIHITMPSQKTKKRKRWRLD